MKRIIILLLVYTSVSNFYINGQNLIGLSIDELVEMKDTIEDDPKLLVDVFNELSFKWRTIDKEISKTNALRALSLADSIDYKLGKSFSLICLGLIAKREYDIVNAEIHFLEALKLRQEEGSENDIASVYNNLGLLWEHRDPSKAGEYFELGLKVLPENSAFSMRARIHNNYGGLLINERRYDSAIMHLDSALNIRRKIGGIIAKANSFLNLSYFYHEIGDSSQFKIHIDSAKYYYDLKEYDSGRAKVYNLLGTVSKEKDKFSEAEGYFNQAMNLAKENSLDYYIYMRNLGTLAIHNNEYGRALNIHQECLTYFESIDDKRESASILINLGTINYDQSKFTEAITFYKKSLQLLEKFEDYDLELKALLFLSASFENLEEYEKSNEIIDKYLQLNEKFKGQKVNILHLLLDQKDLLVQSSKLKEIQADNALQLEKELHEKMKMYYIFSGCLIFFLLMIAIVVALIYRQKKQIADLKIDELLHKKERDTNYTRLEVQEKERNRIAMDLHDRLGGTFTAIKFSLDGVESTLSDIKDENREHYFRVNSLVDKAFEEVRDIAYNLKNSTLANFGLKIALESLVESLKGKNIKIALLTHGIEIGRLKNKIEINTYQIIQELVSNALKHARANKLTIQLNKFDDRLNISVEDNGVGFELDKVKVGMGIKNIEARVHGLEGTLNIDSKKSKGTTVMIDIPIH